MTPISLQIKVAVPLPLHGLYSYIVPNNLEQFVKIGMRVLVPFGRRKLGAYVIEKFPMTDSGQDLKMIIDVLDGTSLYPEEMVPFFHWIADYYIFPIGEVIRNALPAGLDIRDRTGLHITPSGQKALEEGTISAKERSFLGLLNQYATKPFIPPAKEAAGPSSALITALVKKGWIEKQRILTSQKVRARMIQKVSLVPEQIDTILLSKSRRKIADYLKTSGSVEISLLKELSPNAVSLARKMALEGQLEITQTRVLRDPFGDPITPDKPPRLTPEQLVAIHRIKSTLGLKFQTYLLSGVTGSGKTEIYLQLSAHTIALGLTVLILVPEIALISQIERRFRARFDNQVAVLHSGLSIGERFDQWEQIVQGNIPICIGVRSAIFAPLKKIGLIVVDEEHDTSYKQEDRLRYNARDLAVVRGSQSNATVILGSATPSIQSYYNAIHGKFIEVPLHHRVEKRPLPQIEVVDLTKDREIAGTRRFITPLLYNAMRSTLENNEQVLLFLNRRGFANYPICKACGEAFKCKNCDISLTLHKSIKGFKCHLCGYTCPDTIACVHCGSNQIRHLGMGTEKVEAAVKQLFPKARVARMDRDTIAGKGALLKILKALKNGEIQVLIGTQMVAKGHDFPNITLVGIICADLSLNFPDFRAGERTFQILAQVAGRTGRGDRPGRVILQSFHPDHFSIAAARKQDFREFYGQEIAFRKALNYPPFSRLIQIRISGPDKNHTAGQADMVSRHCSELKQKHPDFKSKIEILGPIEAPLFRVAKRYRFQMIIKCRQAALLHRFVRELLLKGPAARAQKGVGIDIDVDPFFML